MPPVTDMPPADQAAAAFRALLEERPDFADTRRYSIEDIKPFLEGEEGFPAWLDHYQGNNRALTAIWAQVVRQVQNAKNEAPAPPIPEASAPPAPKEKAPAKPKASPKPKITPPQEPAIEVQAEVVEDNRQVVVSRETPPALLEEQVLQASRALAEQFALVKHHEMAIRQAAQAVEEATEALNQARQNHTNSQTAYTNALEDLARLMATSLGSKANDFTKLMAKALQGEGGKTR